MNNNILLFFRKNKSQFFSIERVFGTLWDDLRKVINVEKVYAKSEKTTISAIIQNVLFFRRFKAGVYHITGEIYYAILFFPRSRSIITIHDCNYIRNNTGWKNRLRKKIWFDLPIKHSRFVTVISEETKRDVIRLSGCNENKVVLIANPVDPAFTFTPKKFNKDKPRILQVGTRWNKNLPRVVAAAKELPCVLCIIGKLSSNDKDILATCKIEYENYVDISIEELNQQYALSDIVLFASLSEGFGLPILEAQAAGRIIITSNVSPMKEIGGHGTVLVDPLDIKSITDGIKLVINNEALRSEKIKLGYINTQRFNSKQIAAQYAELYNIILDQK